MSKFSTLNYLINSYNAGKKEVELLQCNLNPAPIDMDELSSEPSFDCIRSILNFASQYEVVKSKNTGNIELNLN